MGLGLCEGEFLTAYRENRKDAHGQALDACPIVEPLERFMSDKSEWTGTATDLLAALEEKPPSGSKPPWLAEGWHPAIWSAPTHRAEPAKPWPRCQARQRIDRATKAAHHAGEGAPMSRRTLLLILAILAALAVVRFGSRLNVEKSSPLVGDFPSARRSSRGHGRCRLPLPSSSAGSSIGPSP